jgi:hypothetical protein
MKLQDDPFWMRVLLTLTVVGALVAAILVIVSITAIVRLLPDRGASPAAWTLTGTLLGAAGAFWAGRILDNRRRRTEKGDIASSLHAELADRAARCANDYLEPWQAIKEGRRRKTAPPDWVAKFRPVNPVVYPSVAAKLSLLPPAAVFSVVQFFFRLDQLTRQIDRVAGADPKVDLNIADYAGLVLVGTRLLECLHPALGALEKLDAKGWAATEDEAGQAYPHIRNSNKTLRDILRDHAVKK